MDIAIIGTGGIAQKAYFPLLATMPGINLVAVHSRTIENARKSAQRWHIPLATNDIKEILSKKPQAAIVVSTTESHFGICKQLLENGIDVYCEKPLTESSTEAFTLDAIAKENQRILCVGYNRRHALLYRQAKQMMSGHKIELAVIQKHRTQASNPSLFQQYLDDTIHQIDLMRFFCGDVTAIRTEYTMEKGVLISAVSTVQLPSGGLGIITICNRSGAWQENAALHAERISVQIDAFQQLRVLKDDMEEVYGSDRAGKWIPSLKERGFEGELDHFFQCVKTRRQPATNANEAAKTQRLMEDLVRASGDALPLQVK